MGVVYSHYYTYLVRTEYNPVSASTSSSPGPGYRSLGPLTAGLAATAAAAAAAVPLRPGTPSSDTEEATGTAAAAAGGGTVVEVRRRFSDFEALHSLLKAHYPGYFIPPVPDKSFFESRFAGDSFLKVRKVDLQVRCAAFHSPASIVLTMSGMQQYVTPLLAAGMGLREKAAV